MSKTTKIISTKKAAAKPKTSEDVNEVNFSALIVVFFGGALKPAFFHVEKILKKQSSGEMSAGDFISRYIKEKVNDEKDSMIKSLWPCGYMYSIVRGASKVDLDSSFEEFLKEAGNHVTGSIFRNVTKEVVKGSLIRIFQTQPAVVDDSVTSKKGGTKKAGDESTAQNRSSKTKQRDSSEEEKEAKPAKKSAKKASVRDSSEEEVKPVKKSTKKASVRDSDEEEVEVEAKPAKKPTKKAPVRDSSEEEEVEVKPPKKQSKRKVVSDEEEEEEDKPRHRAKQRDSSASGLESVSRSRSPQSVSHSSKKQFRR